MKGVIFTEFLEMVEEKFGLEMTDTIIIDSKLPSEGAYTAVGNYPHNEIITLVLALHQQTQIPVRDLLVTFGRFLFGRLADRYGILMKGINDPFQLLENLEVVIHQEVKKLYSDAKTPLIEVVSSTPEKMELTYSSHRSMGDVAEGLILGCSDFYGVPLSVLRQNLTEDGTKVRFTIKKEQHGVK
ncbi:heme NO-binding domain-containing protein [Bacteroidota bacterium]